MCPRHLMKGRLGNMSFDLYRRIIDEIAGYPKTALIPFYRGESMLHPQFIDMLAYARRKNIRPIQFTTNATRMKPEIARALIDLEIDFVSFSVDSINPETYASIRKGGRLEEVLENIEYFCEYKNLKAKARPEIQVSVVRTDDNEDEIADFVKYWRRRVDRVRVFERHTGDGNFGSVKAPAKEYSFEKRLPCLKVFNEISIYWNGQAALCCHDWDRTRPIGDVSRNSIREIWHNEAYEFIRRTHLKDIDDMEELCKNCDQWKAYYLPQGVGAIGELHIHKPETAERESLGTFT